MRSMTYMLLLTAAAISMTGCQKAHEAGNDSMKSGHGVVATGASNSDASTSAASGNAR